MLYRKVFIVLLLALVLGCADKAKLEQTYREQLKLYNDQIRDSSEGYVDLQSLVVRSAEMAMVEIQAGGLDGSSRRSYLRNKETYDQKNRSLNELVEKRNALKIKVIEQLGSLPAWWKEVESPVGKVYVR